MSTHTIGDTEAFTRDLAVDTTRATKLTLQKAHHKTRKVKYDKFKSGPRPREAHLPLGLHAAVQPVRLYGRRQDVTLSHGYPQPS